MRALFKCEEDYYQPIKTKEVEAFKEGYCKFERNSDRCKTGSLPDYLRDTYLHLSSPINNFNDSKDGSKINLSLQIMFRNSSIIIFSVITQQIYYISHKKVFKVTFEAFRTTFMIRNS